MATSNNPLAPDPVTDLDGPDVYPPMEPEPQEDIGGTEPDEEDETDEFADEE